jgi:hypothetical protein
MRRAVSGFAARGKGARSAGDVVGQLILGQLEADQQLESGPVERGANRGLVSGSIAASASPDRRLRVIRSRMSGGRVASARSMKAPPVPLATARACRRGNAA